MATHYVMYAVRRATVSESAPAHVLYTELSSAPAHVLYTELSSAPTHVLYTEAWAQHQCMSCKQSLPSAELSQRERGLLFGGKAGGTKAISENSG